MIIYNPFRGLQNTLKVLTKHPANGLAQRLRVACDYSKLYRRKGLLADEYMEYRFDQCSETFRNTFLGLNEQRFYLDYLNPKKYYILARNKYLTHKILEDLGIRKPILYAYYQPEGRGESACVSAHAKGICHILRHKGVESCVVKSTESSHGDNVHVVTAIEYKDDEALMHLHDGNIIKLSDLLGPEPLVFESRVKQTAQLSAFNADSINTVRFMTTLYPNGEARIVATFIKIGRAGRCVDNAGEGGNVDASIDTETGTLQYAIQYDNPHHYHDIEVHPDNQNPINGVHIDHWQAIKEDVLRFQQALPYVKAAGWDIAITEEGPVVIEVNDMWDRLGQLFLRRGWRNEIRDCYLAWKKTGKNYPFVRRENMLKEKHLEKIARNE